MKYFSLSKPKQIQFINGTACIFVDWWFLIKVDPSPINHATECFIHAKSFTSAIYKNEMQ